MLNLDTIMYMLFFGEKVFPVNAPKKGFSTTDVGEIPHPSLLHRLQS